MTARPPSFIPSLHHPSAPADAPAYTAANLYSSEGLKQGFENLSSYYSASSPIGIFRQQPVDEAARSRLLSSITNIIPPPSSSAPIDPTKAITGEELWQAVKRSPFGKDPGLDGLTYEFYKFFFPSLKDAFCHVFNLAYASASSSPLSPLLLGLITLIHKGKSKPLDRISSFRPITLLGCDVKLLSMIILDRAQEPTSLILDGMQGAFLRGRGISENIQFMLNFQDYFKSIQHPLWIILTDLTFAYDSVDRDTFYKALQRYGFQHTLADVRWFSLFLSGTSLCVNVNGHITPPFPSARGFPQGLNLSTTCWLIMAQTWHSRAHQLVIEGRWLRPSLPTSILSSIPVHLKKQLPLGHLLPPLYMFADDINHMESGAENALVIEEWYADIKAGVGVELSVPKCAAVRGTGNEVPSPSGTLGCFQVSDSNEDSRSLGIPVHHQHCVQRDRALSRYPGAMLSTLATWNLLQPCLLESSHILSSAILSKIVFQARHLCPSKEKIQSIQQVCQSQLRQPQSHLQLPPTLLPLQAIISLHKHEGGIGSPAVLQVVHSLQSRTLLLLFSPGLHPWRIGAFLAISNAIAPWFSSPSVLITCPHLLLHRLPPKDCRIKDMASALSALRPFRIILPHQQSPHSILAEPLLGNLQIQRNGSPLLLRDLSSTARCWTHLRHLRVAYHSPSLPSILHHELSHLLTLLPPPWSSVVTAESEPPLGDWVYLESCNKVAYIGLTHPPSLFSFKFSGQFAL